MYAAGEVFVAESSEICMWNTSRIFLTGPFFTQLRHFQDLGYSAETHVKYQIRLIKPLDLKSTKTKNVSSIVTVRSFPSGSHTWAPPRWPSALQSSFWNMCSIHVLCFRLRLPCPMSSPVFDKLTQRCGQKFHHQTLIFETKKILFLRTNQFRSCTHPAVSRKHKYLLAKFCPFGGNSTKAI